MPHQKFIARLQAVEDLSEDERRQIAALPATLRQVADGETVLRQGETVSRCVFVVHGFLYQTRIVGDRSQILAFHVPGDMPCLHTLLVSPIDADLVGLGPTIVGAVAHSQLKQLLDGSVHLTRAFWRETLIDARSRDDGSPASARRRPWPRSRTSSASSPQGWSSSAFSTTAASRCR